MTRLYSFDALKVLSIFMVIVGHVFFYSFHEANNLMWKFIDVVNMPMFMFISGFFSGIPTGRGVLKRLRTLVLPTLMAGMLYTFIKEQGIESFFTSSMHNGYWFCFTLFCLYIFYWICSLLEKCFQRCKLGNYNKVIFLSVGVILVLVCYRFLFQDNIFTNALSIPQFYRYVPFFVYGIFVNKISKLKNLLEQSNLLFTISLVGIMAGVYMGTGYTACRLVIAFSYINIMLYFFQYWFANRHNRWVEYVATRTIDIYLFHFFLLPTYFFVIPSSFNPNHNILLSLTVVGIISVIVLFGTLLLTKFIETSKMLSFLLLGTIK